MILKKNVPTIESIEELTNPTEEENLFFEFSFGKKREDFERELRAELGLDSPDTILCQYLRS